jgi:hypothetical protein
MHERRSTSFSLDTLPTMPTVATLAFHYETPK